MKCFYAAATELHDPIFRLTAGAVVRNAEQAERAHLLLQGLAQLDLTTDEPAPIPREALLRVHSERFLDFIETAWEEWQKIPGAGPEVVPNTHAMNAEKTYPSHVVPRAGWHFSDTSAPIGPHSWQAALASAATAHAAAQAVLAGEGAAYALCRPPGHHAGRDFAAGFCYLNNSAIAAQELLAEFDRVAILDIDVHHGNGTQDIFYRRADVLTVSLHADPARFYPFFWGHAAERGEAEGLGFNLNIPLPRGTGDKAYLEELDRALARIEAFAPGALVVALGLDAHESDPFRGLAISTTGFGRIATRIAALELPTLLVQEGGYLSDDLGDNLQSFLDGFSA